MSNVHFIYWDANVFIHYLEATPAYIDTLDAILEEVTRSKGKKKIITSVISKTEVAFLAQERVRGALSSGGEAKIDALWSDPNVIVTSEVHNGIALKARECIRLSFAQGWSGLRSADALHLASATWLGVKEIHTYEPKWQRYSTWASCPIIEPITNQARMPISTP